ncbi:aminotransferase class I/II-fold pyridoxal phosphate-dependent enzyme (plasmid) [Streptomyces sp. BHT-5-2]|uniref:MalY/PatB family protein n=1 Tax=unclassified Streptomyces TaxID=2593676 RepID=UPI001C8E96F6|nr:aminotransferase class I/II-fold pyridoxal phosphate-dependent enzyme [Streptomyces sp. BHT-5-2]QZL08783.1 aminotransferase class I/II-fold pyridoxal phosphate-dependent enzyme [Streptomyces sp. BHT-5-2]
MSPDHPPFLDTVIPSDGNPSPDIPRSLLSAKYPRAIGAWVAEMAYGVARPIHSALTRELNVETLGYNDPISIGLARESIVRWMDRAYGWHVRSESIGFVSDIVTGFGAVLRHYLAPASTVIVPTPAYAPLLTVPILFGHRVVEVPSLVDSNGYHMDMAGIDRALSQGGRMVVLCNPHNPTGRIFTAEELGQLARLVDSHGARVFSDEVHAPLTLVETPHLPYANLSETAASHAITATSASKGWNISGLKCAQLIFSASEDMATWQRVADFYIRSVSRLGVSALRAAYDDPASHAWLSAVREQLTRNNALVAKTIAEHIPGMVSFPSEATYLAWLDCRQLGLVDPAAFFRERVGLAMSEGSEFSAPGHIRLNFALPERLLRNALSALVAGADILQSGQSVLRTGHAPEITMGKR